MRKRFLFFVAALLLCSFAHVQATAVVKITDGDISDALRSAMETHANQLLIDLDNSAQQGRKDVDLEKKYMSDQAVSDVKKMWKSSPMTSPDANMNCRLLKTSTGWQIRGIPVDMLAADQDEKRQELTINFDPKGNISGVAIAIELHRYNELMEEGTTNLEYTRRQIIVDFVENFRTAYNRKDLRLLESVFSDKALIITGRVVEEVPNSDVTRMTMYNKKVVYLKQSKQEYLERLKKVFDKAKYINVKFDDIEITQHTKYDNLYAVTLKQTWRSSGYSDLGYLMLLIDFKDETRPLIQVRTWQPIKDKQGNIILREEDAFHVGSFVPQGME